MQTKNTVLILFLSGIGFLSLQAQNLVTFNEAIIKDTVFALSRKKAERHEGTKKLLIRGFSYLRVFVPSCSQNHTAKVQAVNSVKVRWFSSVFP